MKIPWALRAVAWLVSLPPRRWVLALGAGLGTLVWRLGIRRRVALENARFALGDEAAARAAVRGAYRNLGMVLVETFLAIRMSDAELAEAVRLDNVEALEGAVAQGKGVVVVAGHFGNWELLGAAASRRGIVFHAIVRQLKGPMNALLHGARAIAGLREIGAKGTFHEALDVLRRGEILAVIIDQNMLRSRGIFVDFFGRKACTTPAPALLADRTGALVMGAFPVREGPMRWRVVFEGPYELPKDVEEHTQRLQNIMESWVRRHPDHWFWMHRRWKTRPLEEAEAPGLPPREAPASPAPPADLGPGSSR